MGRSPRFRPHARPPRDVHHRVRSAAQTQHARRQGEAGVTLDGAKASARTAFETFARALAARLRHG